MAAMKKKAPKKSVTYRSTRYSAKPRDTADREERRAFAQRKKRKLDTIKATSSRSNMTADKRERVTKKALATAKSGTTYTTYSKKPRTGGAGADTIASRKGVAGPAMNAAYKAGQTAKKKAAGAKVAAKKQNYR